MLANSKKRKRVEEPSSLQFIALRATLKTCRDRFSEQSNRLTAKELEQIQELTTQFATEVRNLLELKQKDTEARILKEGLSYTGTDAITCTSSGCTSSFQSGDGFGGCCGQDCNNQHICNACLKPCGTCDGDLLCDECTRECYHCEAGICADCQKECENCAQSDDVPFCSNCVITNNDYQPRELCLDCV